MTGLSSDDGLNRADRSFSRSMTISCDGPPLPTVHFAARCRPSRFKSHGHLPNAAREWFTPLDRHKGSRSYRSNSAGVSDNPSPAPWTCLAGQTREGNYNSVAYLFSHTVPCPVPPTFELHHLSCRCTPFNKSEVSSSRKLVLTLLPFTGQSAPDRRGRQGPFGLYPRQCSALSAQPPDAVTNLANCAFDR